VSPTRPGSVRVAAGHRWLILVALCLTPCISKGPAWAVEQSVADDLRLSPESRNTFARLQDQWLEWLAATYQADADRAEAALDALLADADRLDMSRLPDLSLGAAGRAVEFASQGDFEVAQWCLSAAERLDPRGSEVAFAAARVARWEGRYGQFVRWTVRGYSRLLQVPLYRSLWLSNLSLWVLVAVLASGAIFVGLLMATRGAELLHDVFGFIERFLPSPLAMVLTAVLLLWPVLLPAGLLWLVVYWSILLWSYGSSVEKVVLVGIWVVLGAAPLLLNEQRQRVRIELAPATISMENLEEGRLKGTLLRDLNSLKTALPDSNAVTHLLADLYCRLGEWNLARELYLDVLEEEPRNTTALINVGACFYHAGDHIQAVDYFQQATATEGPTAAAHFNLSQIYSDHYRFHQAGRELQTARTLDSAGVGVWLIRAATEKMIVLSGGIGRSGEVRDQLRAVWRSGEVDSRWSALWPTTLPLPLALAFLAIAAGLYWIVRRSRMKKPPAVFLDRDLGGRWLQMLLPGFAEAEAGQPVRAFLAVLVPISLLTLPLIDKLGYRLPILFAPAGTMIFWISILSLAAYLGARILRLRA
jgi:tetratricopeptide (TPR) repeat protein